MTSAAEYPINSVAPSFQAMTFMSPFTANAGSEAKVTRSDVLIFFPLTWSRANYWTRISLTVRWLKIGEMMGGKIGDENDINQFGQLARRPVN